MMIDVRFFSYCITEDNEIDICEVDEATFSSLKGVISYQRHTVFDNGSNQICLTTMPDYFPFECEVILEQGA